MSVYFSKHSLNGYRDHIGTVDPAIRDRLLSAINELTLLGPGLPRHKHLSTRMHSQTSRARSTRTANRPARSERAAPQIDSAAQVKTDQYFQSLKQPTSTTESSATHGVLKGKIKHRISASSSNPEKGNVIVFTRVLHQETQYKTIEVTSLTKSVELVNIVLQEYDAHTKDPNLFYLAMETGIKSKDSGLPISQMIVLENDARPLELQSCQPQGETKFHLKMKSGGLVRVRTNILNPGPTSKTVFIARCTTAQELIKLIITGCKSDEALENFVLREGSADFQVDRILAQDEYPLEVQSNWKPEQERSFFLSRINKSLHTSPARTAEIEVTSDELKNEIEKQNQTITTLNETIKKLQLEQSLGMDQLRQDGLRSSRNDTSRRTTVSVDSGYIKMDYDQIDDINMKPFDTSQHENEHNDLDVDEGQAFVEEIRQRKTSIDALDLHPGPTNSNGEAQTKSSQTPIDKLRRSFYQFQKQSIDALDLCDGKKDKRQRTANSRSSQIERFRLKLLEYYNYKVDGPQRRISSVLTPPRPRRRNTSRENDLARSYSASDAESTKIDPDFRCEFQTIISRRSSLSNTCDKEIEEVFECSPTAREFPGNDSESPSFLSIFDILEEMKLVTVTLRRDPGKELGLEIAHVTQTGSPVDQENNPEDVVYVFHKGDGQTAVVESPTEHTSTQNDTSLRGFTAITKEEFSTPKNSDIDQDDRDDVFSSINVEPHIDNTTLNPHNEGDATSSNHVKPRGENTVDQSSKIEPFRAFSQWREGRGPKPCLGVRIVGIAKGSIAGETDVLERDDVIVEVNGRNVLNSSLDVVIATLKECNTVRLVVAREKRDLDSKGNTVEPSPLPSPPPSCQEDMKALTDQVQQLVTKVTELQDSLTKKDKTIASLKKSLMKKKLKINSKEKIIEGEQVMV